MSWYPDRQSVSNCCNWLKLKTYERGDGEAGSAGLRLVSTLKIVACVIDELPRRSLETQFHTLHVCVIDFGSRAGKRAMQIGVGS